MLDNLEFEDWDLVRDDEGRKIVERGRYRVKLEWISEGQYDARLLERSGGGWELYADVDDEDDIGDIDDITYVRYISSREHLREFLGDIEDTVIHS